MTDEMMTGHQEVAGSTSVSDSEIVSLRLGLDECLSITSDISKLPHLQDMSH